MYKNTFAKRKSFENLIECFLRISGSTETVMSNDFIDTAFYVRREKFDIISGLCVVQEGTDIKKLIQSVFLNMPLCLYAVKSR